MISKVRARLRHTPLGDAWRWVRGRSAAVPVIAPPSEPELRPFREHALAHRILDGLKGLEIGAASHNPFGLATRNVTAPDRYEVWAAEECRFGVDPAPVDIWAYADSIPVPDSSEDFILTSHVVEHLPNAIGAFIEWDRIVRPGGYVFMIVPHRDALPEDAGRPLTPLDHIIMDHELSRTAETHPTDGVAMGRLGHYHIFTPDTLHAVVSYMVQRSMCSWCRAAREDVDTKVGNGFTLVYRKPAR